jgi:hypothetical protein
LRKWSHKQEIGFACPIGVRDDPTEYKAVTEIKPAGVVGCRHKGDEVSQWVRIECHSSH